MKDKFPQRKYPPFEIFHSKNNYGLFGKKTYFILGRLKALPKCGHVHFSRLQQSLAEMSMNSLLPPCPK